MKKEWIEKMKRSGRLKLTFRDYFSHFSVVWLLFIPLIVESFGLFRYYVFDLDEGDIKNQGMLRLSIVFAVIGTIYYFIQYSKLKFKIVETNLPGEKLQEIILKTAKEFKWTPLTNTKDLIVIKTNPDLWTSYWGEHITILFDSKKLLISSICDPDGKASVFSVGRNKENINRLIENIKRAEIKIH